MEKEVFITKIASYFPNNPIENDEMEDFLGLIGGKPSRVKNIILRQNGIKRRYYALNKKQEITHTNAEMAGLAIKKMLSRDDCVQSKSFLVAHLPLTSTSHRMPPWCMGRRSNIRWRYSRWQGSA